MDHLERKHKNLKNLLMFFLFVLVAAVIVIALLASIDDAELENTALSSGPVATLV